MFDRNMHEPKNAIYRQFPKGGVAPSRYELTMHYNQLKRLSTLQEEAREKRHQRAEALVEASITIMGRVLRAVASVLNTSKLRPRHELK